MDQDNETQKIIAEQMKVLPKDLVNAIISVDYKTKLQEITKRQRLLIDQAGKLEMETTLVMIGLEPLADYTNNLQRELGVTSVRAREIAMDVSENIFKPIRSSLQKMNTEQEDEENFNGRNDIETTDKEQTIATETDLDRDQILNEIENPSIIGQEKKIASEDLSIWTPKEIETLPGQEVREVKNIPVIKPDLVQAKMTGTTFAPKQVVDIKSDSKLPEIPARPSAEGGEKKRPSSGVDPYREEIK